MKPIDELRRRDQLLRWTEQGRLTVGQLAAAMAPERPQPAARHWLAAFDLVLALFGCVLLALGMIFFFAFNWDDLHRFAKLGLAVAVLTGFTGVALRLPRGSNAAQAVLLGAALATGGLLALIGQIYQTGADIWQLFAVWAVLLLPWALLSRSTACWVLFWAVANLALVRYFATTSSWLFGGMRLSPTVFFVIAGFNGLLLVLFEQGLRPLPAGRTLPRLAGTGLLAALGLGAAIGWWRSELVYLLPALATVYLLGIPCYRRWRRDLLLLALQAYSAIAVLASGLACLLRDLDEIGLVWILGLFVLLGSALASVLLQRWAREEGV